MSAETVTIEHLGAQGDGIARNQAGPIFIPFTLAGETATIARIKDRGMVMALQQPAAERVRPPCRHFGPDGDGGACGGCNLQHFAHAAYDSWKRSLVVDALAARGLHHPVEALASCQPGERRRLTLTARRTEAGMLLGFSEASSHTIISITECPIATPAIAGRLDILRRLAASLAASAKPFRLQVLATASGLDIAASGLSKLSERQRRMAVETALDMPDIARVTVEGETLVEARRPVIHFGAVAVTPPPGGFVQASAIAERQMAELVVRHLQPAKRTADLFSGCGTFALRLASQSAVHAVENDRPALVALEAGFRATQGLKPVTTEKRDLFRSPLFPDELKAFDGVVFDPPRAGAEAQTTQLAASKVARIAAVSCNPLTLARDLTILVAGGYRITLIKPIDQFLWSPHVEVVALLER